MLWGIRFIAGAGMVAVAMASVELPAAADSSSASAYAWGSNEIGQLGNPTNLGSSTVANPLPVQHPASGPVTYTNLVSGQYHACGLTTDASISCWGWNRLGQLGNPANTGFFNNTPNEVPLPVQDPAGGAVSWASLTAGTRHTCGLTTGGVAYCWGFNGYGELGNSTNSGTTNPNSVPLPVQDPAGGAVSWASLAAGPNRTCGVTTTGDAYCWGPNQYG